MFLIQVAERVVCRSFGLGYLAGSSLRRVWLCIAIAFWRCHASTVPLDIRGHRRRIRHGGPQCCCWNGVGCWGVLVGGGCKSRRRNNAEQVISSFVPNGN